MPKISKDEIVHLAELGNISLADGETEALAHDLSEIVGYIEQLGELDTTGVEPTYAVNDLSNVWREDTVIDYGLTREDLLDLAPASENHQIRVPKVL